MIQITEKVLGESAKDYVIRQLTEQIVHIGLEPEISLSFCDIMNVV